MRHVLTLQTDPTLLVGHSYGCEGMSALGSDAPNVVGLVFDAGFGLDEGDSIDGLLALVPPTPAVAHLQIDENGLAWLPEEAFLKHFAPDVDPVETRAMCAVAAAVGCVDTRRRDDDTGYDDLADVERRRPARRSRSSPTPSGGHRRGCTPPMAVRSRTLGSVVDAGPTAFS